MSRYLLWICIALSSLTLLVGFIFAGWWMIGLGSVFLGVLWWFLEYKNIQQAAPTFLIIFTALATLGMGIGAGFLWMLVAEIFLISAWDLARFYHRLEKTPHENDSREIERTHVRKLAVVDGVGLLASLAAAGIHFRLQFIVFFLIALLALFFLSWFISIIKEM